MRRKIMVLYLFIFFFFFTGVISLSYADSAQVMPKGVVGVTLEGKFYFPIEKKFNNDEKKEDIATDYNVNLNSDVFPDLAVFGPNASIGNSVVSFKYEGEDVITLIQYGLTDRITVGVRIPYYWRRNKVDASLDTSNWTVGKNVGFNTLAPRGIPGTVPLTKSDVLNLLGPGLDVGTTHYPGFGFKPFRTWSGNGVGDIEVGGRYQYLKTDNWRLAFTGGVRFPTGEKDDPDNLVDIGLGDGAYGLLFHFNNDYIGIKNLVLNVTPRYYLIFPQKVRLRVPESVHKPITTNEESVHRDLGDVIELETSGTYNFFDGFGFSLLYKFGYKLRDHVSGDRGFNYESLESETRTKEHIGIASLSYSTIPLFEKQKFPIPITASVSYRNRFAGMNILNSQYISLTLAIYF